MDNGKWTVMCGQWCVDNGEWTMVSGQWCVDNGEWTMVSGQWDLASEYLLFNKREKKSVLKPGNLKVRTSTMSIWHCDIIVLSPLQE